MDLEAEGKDLTQIESGMRKRSENKNLESRNGISPPSGCTVWEGLSAWEAALFCFMTVQRGQGQGSLELGRKNCSCCSPAPLLFVVFVSKFFLLMPYSMEIRHPRPPADNRI